MKNDKFSYVGNGFKNGECGIKIVNASKSDDGTWSCNMGKNSSIEDEFQFIHTYVHGNFVLFEKITSNF